MKSGNKKLVLVYPPYSTATAPPLGVCFLKSFVEKSLPNWSVKVMDLNLTAHQDYFSLLDHHFCSAGDNMTARLAAETLLSQAARTFSGQNDNEFYNRADRYLLYSGLWHNLSLQLANPSLMGKVYRQTETVPAQFTQYVELILQEQPTVIGLSICYTQQLYMGLCLAREIKKYCDIPVIAGGTFFNSKPDEFLDANPGVFDFIISGEAEKSLAEFLRLELVPETVAGLVYLKDGKAIANPPVIEGDLDYMGEPDFSDLNLHSYYIPEPVLPIMTSRGCYWQRCAFCAHYKSAGHTYRRRSISQVIEEIKKHVGKGIRNFAIIDEMIAPSQFEQLADAIMKADLDIRYYASAKPMNQFNRHLLVKMYDSGCRYILWGVESGCQRILDLMDKGTNIQEIEQILENAYQVGLKNHVFVIFGFPTETRQELQLTLDLLARHKKTIAMVHRGVYELEADTPVFNEPQKFSITRYRTSNTPGVYEFGCSAGMTRQESREAFNKNILFLRSFATDTPELGDAKFRDHLLLLYSHQEAAKPYNRKCDHETIVSCR